MSLKICHLYPDLLDLYGDRGNIITLTQRAKWRGIETEVIRASLGDVVPWRELDILMVGGGSDREQEILVQDLMQRRDELEAAIRDGLVVLLICGGYQLFGQYYQTGRGEKIPGLGLLDCYTVAGNKRLIGNVIIENPPELGGLGTIVGFENHSGQTFLGPELKPLGHVVVGSGNNGKDGQEGARYLNVFATYLHGPILPKNPQLADSLLRLALERRGREQEMTALDDRLEHMAHQAILKRFGGRAI